MANKPLPSQEVLRQLLDYNPDTGDLLWRKRGSTFFEPSQKRSAEHIAAIWNKRYAGNAALSYKNEYGYKVGAISGQPFQSHRVIWRWYHGSEPDQVDHINGDRSDNRICNLRSVSALENARNVKRTSKNHSGVVGVKWCKRSFVWIAEIKAQGRSTQLGRFNLFWDAVAARKKAEVDMGFHTNHGRSS